MTATALAKVISDGQDATRLAALSREAPSEPTDVHALPASEYLNATVVPVLLQGLEALQQQREHPNPAARPADALEFLAAYLISNNPQCTPQQPVEDEAAASPQEAGAVGS